jgi:hypothetical protein
MRSTAQLPALPCPHCFKQATKGPGDHPHDHLVAVEVQHFRGETIGAYERTVYRCSACGTKIKHSSDFAPYWWFVN